MIAGKLILSVREQTQDHVIDHKYQAQARATLDFYLTAEFKKTLNSSGWHFTKMLCWGGGTKK